MAVGTILFRSPSAGYDQPMQMWLECHERVLRMCALMQRVQTHVAEHGVDAQARDGATSVLRYFNEAAPRHHADEEEDLFPRLLQRLEGDARDTAAQTIEQLHNEHAQLEQDWATLSLALGALARGESAVLDAALVNAYSARYRQHIALEEGVLAPALQLALSSADWREIGAIMARRRGVD